MSRILFVWEMGIGLGHITRLRPLALRMAARGHSVFLAARDVATCHAMLQNCEVVLLGAPADPLQEIRYEIANTYAHVLFNCGFAVRQRIEARVIAWKNLFDFVKPDLIVADSCPTVLLAAHCHSIPAVALGTGFECPPDMSPWPSLRRASFDEFNQSEPVELTILENVNNLCRAYGVATFDRLGRLYHNRWDSLLLTFPELDPYGGRESAKYWGIVTSRNERVPVWPEGGRRRVFAYVSEHPKIETLLAQLSKRPWSAIVVGFQQNRDSDFDSRTSNLHISKETYDAGLLAEQADFCICFGGHGTICESLLAGKPVLALPNTVERYLNAVAVINLGAGLLSTMDDADHLSACLDVMSDDASYRQSAERFAGKYATDSCGLVVDQLILHIECLLRLAD